MRILTARMGLGTTVKKYVLLTALLLATATAQQAAPTLEVLRWNCEQPNTIGTARGYGTLKNLGSKTLEFVKVTMEIFSDKEQKRLISQGSTFITVQKLEPGKESAFEVMAKAPKFAACWLQFETDAGKLETKMPSYAGDAPPRLP